MPSRTTLTDGRFPARARLAYSTHAQFCYSESNGVTVDLDTAFVETVGRREAGGGMRDPGSGIRDPGIHFAPILWIREWRLAFAGQDAPETGLKSPVANCETPTTVWDFISCNARGEALKDPQKIASDLPGSRLA